MSGFFWYTPSTPGLGERRVGVQSGCEGKAFSVGKLGVRTPLPSGYQALASTPWAWVCYC